MVANPTNNLQHDEPDLDEVFPQVTPSWELRAGLRPSTCPPMVSAAPGRTELGDGTKHAMRRASKGSTAQYPQRRVGVSDELARGLDQRGDAHVERR